MDIAADHFWLDNAVMLGLRKTQNIGSSIGFGWLCLWGGLTFLCGPLIGAVQDAADRSNLDLRASLNPPSNPATIDSHVTTEMRGDIYMARKRYRDAIDMYREAGASARIENKIGIAFHQMSELGLAKKQYEQAIKLDHSYAEAINNLGTVYYSAESYRTAIRYFKRSLKCSGPVASVYVNLGAAYFANKDYRESSRYFDQALKLDPDALEGHSGFGTRVQDRAVGDLALFHLYLARTYAKAGSDDRALTYLRKALEEGLKDRSKLVEIPEFRALRTKPEFLDLLAANPKPL